MPDVPTSRSASLSRTIVPIPTFRLLIGKIPVCPTPVVALNKLSFGRFVSPDPSPVNAVATTTPPT